MFQYQTMVSRHPAALCERQRSPPWSSWWSSPVSVTTSVWASAPSPPARLAPSQASNSGSQPWTDCTRSVAGTPPHKLDTCCQLNRFSSRNLLICSESTNRSTAVLSIFIFRICSPVGSVVSLSISKSQWGVLLLYLADRCLTYQTRQLGSNPAC